MREHAHALDGHVALGLPVVTLVTLLLFVGATGKSAQIPLLRLAARRDGGPDAGLGADPRRDDGDGRRLHDRRASTSSSRWRRSTLARRRRRSARATALLAATIAARAERHQEGARVLDRVASSASCSSRMGVGAYAAGIFHLMTHAFFKACLFLGAGSVIHAHAPRAGHAEDGRAPDAAAGHVLRRSSSRRWRSPASRSLAGFFSKDEILWQACSSPHGSTAALGSSASRSPGSRPSTCSARSSWCSSASAAPTTTRRTTCTSRRRSMTRAALILARRRGRCWSDSSACRTRVRRRHRFAATGSSRCSPTADRRRRTRRAHDAGARAGADGASRSRSRVRRHRARVRSSTSAARSRPRRFSERRAAARRTGWCCNKYYVDELYERVVRAAARSRSRGSPPGSTRTSSTAS